MDMATAQIIEKLNEHDEILERLDKRFDQVDKRFEQVDRRFEQVDKRFEQIDRRFNQVDKRFEQVDKRFDILANEVSNIHTRMDGLEGSMKQMINQNLEYKDQVMKLLMRHDQELVFLNKRVKRIENN